MKPLAEKVIKTSTRQENLWACAAFPQLEQRLFPAVNLLLAMAQSVRSKHDAYFLTDN